MKQSVSDLKKTVNTLFIDRDSILHRLQTLETLHNGQATALNRLQHDDLENHHRRNNIKIQGLPDATGPADLRDTVTRIFNDLLNKRASSPL